MALKWDAEQMPVALVATVIYFYFATAFQIGYFTSVGIEFITFVSPGEWLFLAAAMVTPVAILWMPLVLLYRWCRRHLTTRIDTPVGLMALLVTPLLPTGIISGALLVLIGWLLSKVTGIGWIAGLPVLPMVIVWLVFSSAFLIRNFEQHRQVPTVFAAFTLVLAGILTMAVGGAYAKYFAGSKCIVTTKEGKFDRATYLRFLGEGHLLRMGDRIYFIPKDQVSEIICGKLRG